MRFLFLLTICFSFFGCVTKPKDAKDWQQTTVNLVPRGMKASIAKTVGTKEETVNFHHGLGDTHTSPMRSRYPMGDFVAKINDMESNRVLNVSYGPSYMLKAEGKGFLTVDEYVREVKLLAREKGLKLPMVGIGMSMGGSNLITVGLMHPELYSRIILVNPMILKGDQWEKFNIFDPTNPGVLPGGNFTRKEWARLNPFALLKKIEVPVWVTACKQDEFKLFDSTAQWVSEARKAGIEVTFIENENCNHLNPKLDF